MVKTILILASNPKDTPRLRLDQEVREIDSGLQRARGQAEFILDVKLAPRPVDVRRAMLDLKPDIVHFCGHGGGKDGIAFEDETGHSKLVSAEALAGFFELFADKVECVFLNACYSETQAEAIARHIDYVVGMKSGIEDTAAIEFAVAFYDALGAGEPIEFGYKLGCNAIQWAGIPGHLTPILKSKMYSTGQVVNAVVDIPVVDSTIGSGISSAHYDATFSVEIDNVRQQTLRFSLNTMTVGRNPQNHIVVNHERVSDSHGIFRFEGGICLYKDSSRNGSFLRRKGDMDGVRLGDDWTKVKVMDAIELGGSGACVRLTRLLIRR